MASSRNDFPALPGFYKLVLLHLEPVSTTIPALSCFVYPGTQWFYNGLIPGPAPATMDPRAVASVWQLVNCYLLLAMMSAILFRTIRSALSHDPVTQERVLGAALTVLAIADLTHITASVFALPANVRSSPSTWNATTHGNITATLFLFLTRMSWFAGIGRKRYYYGHTNLPQKKL